MGTIKRTFANSLTGTGKLSATNLDSNIPAANIADASVTNVTTLPEALGQAIKSVAGSPPSQAVGDIWYNSVTGTLKNYVTVAAAWASSGNLNTARQQIVGTGTESAGLIAGGLASTGTTGASEEYNGSSWTNGGTMGTGRRIGGFSGTQTAAFFAGGFVPPATNATEEYNGSSWAGGGNLPSTRAASGAAGTLTAGVMFGGYTGGPPYDGIATTNEYDGSTWTAGGNLNTSRNNPGGDGIQTAALAFAGNDAPGGAIGVTESYDGSTWTTSPATLGTSRYSFSSSKAGSTSAAFAFGGLATGGGSLSASEKYDGTSWTADASITTARGYAAGFGTTSSAVIAGGSTPTYSNATEEYTDAFNATRTVTTS